MIRTILNTCEEIKNGRHPYSVLGSIVEEVGELGKEIVISQGDSYKTADVDGPIGESIDVILAATDMIYLHKPDITDEEILEIAKKKLLKWKTKVKEHQSSL